MTTIWTQHTNRVAQATGMVSVQAACSVDRALVLMELRTQVRGWTLDEIAAAVVERRIRFSGLTG